MGSVWECVDVPLAALHPARQPTALNLALSILCLPPSCELSTRSFTEPLGQKLTPEGILILSEASPGKVGGAGVWWAPPEVRLKMGLVLNVCD